MIKDSQSTNSNTSPSSACFLLSYFKLFFPCIYINSIWQLIKILKIEHYICLMTIQLFRKVTSFTITREMSDNVILWKIQKHHDWYLVGCFLNNFNNKIEFFFLRGHGVRLGWYLALHSGITCGGGWGTRWGCQGSNLGQVSVRQAPYPLYSLAP